MSKLYKGKTNMVKIKDINIGDNGKPVFIAGPCVIENREMVMEIADFLKGLSLKNKIIFKLSYDKANRTSIDSFRGPGLIDGIKIIREVKNKYDLPLLVDIHCKEDALKVADVADCIQIPAFLCRQTDLLLYAAKTGKPVNIKKGQFMSPWAMTHQVEKIKDIAENKVLLTERGTSFGYNELIVDMRSIIIMKRTGYPVIFDATHSQQQPPAESGSNTKGRKEFIVPLAKAATAVGADGIYAEIHPDPRNAKSDKETQLTFSEFKELVDEVSGM